MLVCTGAANQNSSRCLFELALLDLRHDKSEIFPALSAVQVSDKPGSLPGVNQHLARCHHTFRQTICIYSPVQSLSHWQAPGSTADLSRLHLIMCHLCGEDRSLYAMREPYSAASHQIDTFRGGESRYILLNFSDKHFTSICGLSANHICVL